MHSRCAAEKGAKLNRHLGLADMPDYRLYCFKTNGHIGLGDWIAAETDELAIAQARRLRPEEHSCEIWREARLVAKLNPQGDREMG